MNLPDSHPTADQILSLSERLGTVFFRCLVTPGLQIEWVSPGSQAILGYAQEDWAESPIFLLSRLHPDDRATLLNQLAEPGWNEILLSPRFQRPDGEWNQIDTALVALRGTAGDLISVEGALRLAVCTAPRESVTDPLDNRALLSNVIDAATDAVIVLDPDLNIQIFNPAAEAMFACPAVEILGKPLNRFLPGDIEAWHTEQIRSMIPGQRTNRRMGRTHVTSGLRANGEEFPLEASISAFESAGRVFYAAVLRDITERKRVEDELRYVSTHDSLTSLYNRFFFEAELERLERRRAGLISVIYADVDGLKYINDTLGHSAGDQLLRDVSAAIQAAFRPVDLVARLGGDEFGVLLPGATAEVAASAVQRIYTNINRLKAHKPEISFGLSIGYATSEDGETIADTIRRADTAMYVQKNRRTSPPRRA